MVASLFAAPERSQGTVVHEAMNTLIPPERADDHAPYALSAPGNLEAAMADAGLRVSDDGEVVCFWRYVSMDDAALGLLCSAGGTRAVQAAGEPGVRDVLQRALAQFQDPRTGSSPCGTRSGGSRRAGDPPQSAVCICLRSDLEFPTEQIVLGTSGDSRERAD